MIDYNIISISKVKIDQLSEFYKKVFKSRYKTLTIGGGGIEAIILVMSQ